MLRSITGYLAQAFCVALRFGQQFLVVPIFLSHWGNGKYGGWLVIVSAVAFLRLFDAGLGQYFGNKLLAAASGGDVEGYENTKAYNNGLLLRGIGFAAPLILGVLLLLPWAHWANLPQQSELLIAVTLLAADQLLRIPIGPHMYVHAAHGRMARYLLLNIADMSLVLGGVILALVTGGGIVRVACGYIGGTLLLWLVVAVDIRLSYRDPQWRFAWPSWWEFKEMVSVSALYLFVPASQNLKLQGVVLTMAYLNIANEKIVVLTTTRVLIGMVKVIVNQMTIVASNGLARAFATRDAEALRRRFGETARLAGGLIGTLAPPVLILGLPTMGLWTGHKVTASPELFYLLLLGTIFASLSEPAEQFMWFTNQPRPIAVIFITEAIAIILLCLVLIPAFGMLGLGLAIAGCEIGIRCLGTPIWSQRLGAPSAAFQLGTAVKSGLLCAVPATLLMALLNWYFVPTTLKAILLICFAWGLIAGPICIALILPAEQRQRIVGLVAHFTASARRSAG